MTANIPAAEQPPRFIVPLFEDVWTPDHAREIHAIGATTILLCVCEQDLVTGERQQQITETAQAARELGLEVWSDLWGVGGLFGGEAPTAIAAKDQHPDNPKVQWLIDRGIDLSAELGASHMFWDEIGAKQGNLPHFQEVRFIEKLADTTARSGLKSTVCMQASYRRKSLGKLEIVGAHTDIDGVGISAYYNNFPGDNNDAPDDYIGGFARGLKALENKHNVQAHMWAQGFHIPYPPYRGAPMEALEQVFAERDWLSVPLLQVTAAARQGVYSFGYWASRRWEAACTEGIKTPAYKERVWQLGTEIVKARQHTMVATEAAKDLKPLR